ncbi:sigma-54 interaction domain-containing protein [Desulfatitalea tepidiphila]|uniref:sigma-54 interaction domain-containing protein n=1 Tax=Desulfatitalea tepidiphila TaxID=1185843 RepID=UPI0006B574D6|nr:sigma-54-dependent Fis family transcriptional regulator [Desulfatitalea tepidiphila]
MAKKISSSDASLISHLKEISTWVSSVQDLDKLLELIIESAARVLKAKAASLLLVDRKSNTLFFQVATGEKKREVKEYRVKMGQGIAGHVAETGKPLLIADVRNDPRWFKEISESIRFETQSIACVPLKRDSHIIGVMQIIDKEDGRPIGENDLELIEEFAALAALALGQAQNLQEVKREIQDLKQELQVRHEMVGKSAALEKVIADGLKVANSKASALILGESGTGKELLARLIHRAGPRKDKPLVVLNCAAMPETLLEDELFGHEKGAFTGAVARKIGKFELAHEGTIFLDEIGEMTPGMQAKLLRVLQEGNFYRVGGNIPISVDVRVLSATNKKLDEEVANGKFREDLYYRLNVVQINMPTLRERKEDIPLLANHFLSIFKEETVTPNLKISSAAMDKMVHYDWPGNIRELRNAIERAVVMGNGKEILPEDLPISSTRTNYPGLQVGLTLEEALNQFKKEFIVLNLKHTSGNRSKAAKLMDIQRTYLSRLISKFDVRDI